LGENKKQYIYVDKGRRSGLLIFPVNNVEKLRGITPESIYVPSYVDVESTPFKI